MKLPARRAKRLTVTVSPEVYRGLHKKVGAGNISRFIDNLAHPYVVDDALEESYRAMAADQLRETDAAEWVDGTAGSALPEAD